MGTLLNYKEQTFFDATAIEILRLAGVDDCVLWKFAAYPSVSGATPDCLYGEPIMNTSALHYTPYKVLGLFQEPTHITDATDQGLDETIEGRIYFARKNLEDVKVPANQFGDRVAVGDIVQIFRKGKFWYFDLKNVERTGWMNDSQVWTHYVADMIRNDSFIPERKLDDGH